MMEKSMSKFSNLITATVTGDIKLRNRMEYVNAEKQVHDNRLMRGIAIGVKFNKIAWVNELESFNVTDPNQFALKDIKIAMVEELFGEFRPYISEIRSALYDENFTRARMILNRLDDLMFRDDI